MTDKLEISFGSMSSPISFQLIKQELKFNKAEVEHFQKDADAIARLRVGQVLTREEAVKAEKRLFNKIKVHIIDHRK